MAIASAIGDAAETYDLTNIGTLFAFALVCGGVLILRVKDPERPQAVQGAVGLGASPRRRGGLHLHHEGSADAGLGALRLVAASIGIVLYFTYGYRHSRLRENA